MSIEKIHEKALHIGSISDLKRELKVDLTQKEEASLEKDFKPFELAESKAEEVQKKIEEQSEEKLKTLKELVSTSKEIKGVAMEKQTGLIGEIEGKVNDTAEQIQKKAQSALSPIEKMRENIENTTKDIAEKITSAWEKFITPIKFGWYSIWAYFGFKYGKEGLAELAKEKVDTTKEDLKKKSEKDEQIVENAGPIALLGTAGLGIFGFIKSQLPKSVADKINTTDKKSFLTGLAQNRALKLFGFGGLTLFGLGQLANAAENPEIKAEMGKMPQDKEGQKTWLKKLVEKSADIGSETKETLMSFISEGWDYARGEKLDEYLSKDEKPREGMVTLEEKFQPVGIHLENMGYDIRDAAEKIGPLLIGTGILVTQIRALEIGALKGSADIVKILTKLVGKNIFGTLFAFSIIMNSVTLAGHKIHVPENNDDLGDWLRELLHLPEVKEILKKNDIPDEVIDNLENNLQETVTILTSEQEREKILKEKRSQLKDAIGEKAESVLYPKRAQLIQQKTTEGVKNFNGKLWRYLRENKDEKVQNLIAKAQKVSERMKKEGKITKKDIQELMIATQGTPVKIHDKSENYIRWSILDAGKTIIQSSGVLCVNPLLSENDQYHAARKIVTDEEGGFLDSSRTGQGLEIGSAFFQGIGGRLRHEVASWKEALDKNDTPATASSFEKIKNEFGIIYKSGEFFLVDGGLNLIALPYTLSKNIFNWLGKGDITTEEFVVETADGITPVLLAAGSLKIMTSLSNKLLNTNIKFGILNVLARYSSGKGQFDLIKKLAHTADLIELLGDSRLQIQDGFYNFISKSRNLTYSLGGIVGGNMRKLAHTTRDLGMAESISRKLEFIERKNKLSRGGHEPTDLLEEMKKELREYFKHHHLDENTHPLAKFARINNVNDIPQARANIMADLQNLRNAQSGLKKGLSSSIQSNARRLQDVIKNIPTERLKKIGGLAGLIALIAIPTATAIGTEYFNNKESANGDNDGLGESYDNVDYGEFGEGIKSEKIDNSAPEMSGVFKAVDNIKNSLIGEDFDINKSLLSNDVQFFIKTGEADMKKAVDDIYPRYENSINSFRKTVQENRKILERYFRENPEKQKKEIKICEFLGLGWKNNKLSLSYMSKEKFENHFYNTFDHVKNNIGDYLDDGHQSGWEKAGEIGKNLTPYVSSWIDTKQAFADIGRGHIKSAILNGTMATLGWTSDVLMTLGALSAIVSGPVGPAAGIGGGAALRGINAAIKTSKFGKGIILGEQALEVGTQTAQGMYLAVEKDITETL